MKKLFTMLLCLSLLFCALPLGSAAAAEETPTFQDVYDNQWFTDDVKYIFQHSLMDGDTEQTFSPEAPLTRLVLTEALFRIEGCPSAPNAGFTDVVDSEAPALNWAVSKHIVTGYGDGTFGPHDPVTREQMAAILYRYVTYLGLDKGERADLSIFSDSQSINAYAREPIAWATAVGLINGMGDGYFAPFGTAQRSHGAALLHRFCTNILALPAPQDPPRFIPASSPDVVFCELDGIDFCFASGVGGWSTNLTIAADGSFSGVFHDSDMGDQGPAYPNGTVYYCSFSGRFGNVQKVELSNGSGYYTMQLLSLEPDQVLGTVEYEDGIKYIYSEPYGLEHSTTFFLFPAGMDTDELPSAYVDWVSMPMAWGSQIPKHLPFWGLYNVDQGNGFFSE